MSDTQTYKSVMFTQAQALEVEIALIARIEELERRRKDWAPDDQAVYRGELKVAKNALENLQRAPLSEGRKS